MRIEAPLPACDHRAMRRVGWLGLMVLLVAAACRPAAAGPRAVAAPAEIAAGVTLTKVASGLSKPVALTFVPGDASGRLAVVEQTGTIRLMKDGVVDPKGKPFLDVSDRISKSADRRNSEQGLLGLAFHPRFAENGRFFVNLTDRKGDTKILQFHVPPGRPLTDGIEVVSQGELWSVAQPYPNHNGGHLAFGPDGLLYVGLGDGGSAGDPQGNGQNPDAQLGKMWAMSPDDSAAPPRMVALGLRNPWRYSFDRATGDLWIGDVGQNKFEEVDVLPAASLAKRDAETNFGWNPMEGLHCYKDPKCDARTFTAPVVEYDHNEGCSITGGYVYRGKRLPALVGRYFYADYCTAMIRSLKWDGAEKTVTDVWDWRGALDPKEQLANLSSFGEDAAGELYLLSIDGDVYRFDPK
jgi:glucose/arabinose dehydrogenase